MFFDFQGPSGRQTDRIFLPRHFFLENSKPWEEESNMGCHEAEVRAHHVGQVPGYMVGPIFNLVGPIAANFGSTDSSWSKTYYIKDFHAEKHKIHNTDMQTARIGGEILPELLLVTLWLNRHHLLQQHAWSRGSSSPHGLLDCGSNLYQTLSCALMIRVTWAVYHDCDIDVLPPRSFVYEM
jgi:hypothetical protein